LLEFLLAALLIAAFITLYACVQQQITIAGGLGWDGREYYKIWSIFSGKTGEKAIFPFCNRIGTPFLAAMLHPADIFTSFKVVNLFSSIIFSFSIYYIAREAGLNFYYSVFSLTLTLALFFSPSRFTQFYPVYTDPPFLALTSISFFFLIKRHFGICFLFLFFAYLFREAAIYISPLYAASAIYLGGPKRRTIVKFLATFLAMITVKILLAHQMGCNGSQFRRAVGWSLHNFSDPERFVIYIAAVSMTAGPLVYFRKMESTNPIQNISAAGFIFSAALSFFGGSDVTRIFYSFFPIYFIFLVSTISARGYIFSLTCLLGYAITNRFGNRILEPLNQLPAGDESGLFWQYPDHARPEVALMVIATWLALFIIYDKIFDRRPSMIQKIHQNAK